MFLKGKNFIFEEHVQMHNSTLGNFFSFYILVSTAFKSFKKPRFLYERNIDLLPTLKKINNGCVVKNDPFTSSYILNFMSSNTTHRSLRQLNDLYVVWCLILGR